jgi:glycosyltransferase involved in cell wall biosynthesis
MAMTSTLQSAHHQVRIPITIVVPCFNEEATLLHLRNTLRSVRQSLAEDYEVHLVLLDDGSTDHTWQALQRLFGTEPDCTLFRHPDNLGVAATILNGIRSAQSEIVCSIDCDGTYDPHQLEKLLPLLTEGVDLVTASPYHSQGCAFNVPAWRLALSRAASAFYRRLLRNKLQTYTSCFRVYRRSALLDLEITDGGFLGVTELIGKLDQRGSVIVECPAILEGRVLGQSKMKTLQVIGGHLRLMGQLLARRGRQRLLGLRLQKPRL